MKKIALTIAIVLGMGMTTFAQDEPFGGGGLFQRGETSYDHFADWADLGWLRDGGLMMPGFPTHDLDDHTTAPLGGGIAVLLGLGGAYLVAKKRKEK